MNRAILVSRRQEQSAFEAGLGFQPGGAVNTNVTDLGVKWVRFGLRWIFAQPVEDGPFNWSKFDSTIDAFNAAGIKVMGLLSNGPKWACGGGTPLAFPAGHLDDYIAYCEAAVSRYRGRIAAYEIWNEPQLNGLTVADAATLTIEGSTVVRSLDPAAKVIGVCANGTGRSWGITPFSRAVLIYAFRSSPITSAMQVVETAIILGL